MSGAEEPVVVPGEAAFHGFELGVVVDAPVYAAGQSHPLDNLQPGHWAALSTNTFADVDPCPQKNCSYSAVQGIKGLVRAARVRCGKELFEFFQH